MTVVVHVKIAISLILIGTILSIAVPYAFAGHGNSETGETEHGHQGGHGGQGEHEHGDHDDHDHGEVGEEEENEQGEFNVRLVGSQETPALNVTSFGRAEVELTNHSMAVRFELTVCHIVNVTMAHIHVGASGVAGPVILFLYHPTQPVVSTDHCVELSEGTLTPSDLIPRPANGIGNWTDFVTALLAGNTYVNVHTTAHPAGEIRGQLVSEEHGEAPDVDLDDADVDE